MMSYNWIGALIAIFGLAIITVLTRGFFLLSDQEIPIPEWLRKGLKYAPLAALGAVVVPEILTTDGSLIHTWQDARLWATPAAATYYFYRRGILGTIVIGMLIYLPLHIGLGW